jgi:AcrR family transcriptional regulator
MATRPAAARRRNAQVRRGAARTRIAAATERLLAERPYRDLSVDLVMAEAGLSRTVFYRHYDGLPEVVLELFATVAAGLATALEADDLHGTLAAAVDAFAIHGPLMRVTTRSSRPPTRRWSTRSRPAWPTSSRRRWTPAACAAATPTNSPAR